MTDQPHTPTETTVRYWYIYARRASAEFNLEQVPDTSEAWAEFDRWLAEHDARIETAARIEGLRLAQQIISGDLPVNESRDRHDMVNAGYLIRELDEEIRDQTLGEQDDD